MSRVRATEAFDYIMDGYPRRKYAPEHFYTTLYFATRTVCWRVERMGRPFHIIARAIRDSLGD